MLEKIETVECGPEAPDHGARPRRTWRAASFARANLQQFICNDYNPKREEALFRKAKELHGLKMLRVPLPWQHPVNSIWRAKSTLALASLFSCEPFAQRLEVLFAPLDFRSLAPQQRKGTACRVRMAPTMLKNCNTAGQNDFDLEM